MALTTAAIVGSAVIGGVAANQAASKSAGATKAATNATIDAQERQFQQTRADTAHLRDLSQQSVGTLGRLQSGDLSAFYASPDYRFNLAEGQGAIDRSAAARGGLLSGAAVKAGQQYASGLASREYGSFVDRLMQSAGLGNTGIGASAAAGANAANNISNAYMTGGLARGNAYAMAGQGINNAVQGGVSNLLLMRYLNNAPTGGAGVQAVGYSPWARLA